MLENKESSTMKPFRVVIMIMLDEPYFYSVQTTTVDEAALIGAGAAFGHNLKGLLSDNPCDLAWSVQKREKLDWVAVEEHIDTFVREKFKQIESAGYDEEVDVDEMLNTYFIDDGECLDYEDLD